MTTITRDTTTITPQLVLGYSADREVPTVTHTVIGKSDPDVTLAPAQPRTGTLAMLFDTAAAAYAADAAHAIPGPWTLADPDVPELNMNYVVDTGSISLSLEDETRALWVLSVPFREVLS